MRRPQLTAEVERRLLVTYRAEPDVVAPLLPGGLRTQLVGGAAVVGICLIRLGGLRPAGWPRRVGLRSESAAHRIAVEWDGRAGVERGVYIPRRDSNALISVLAGGRLFPGVLHRADFTVEETAESFHVAFSARDGSARADVVARVSKTFDSQLFPRLEEASAFFQAGSVGLSPARDGSKLEGLTLLTDRWAVEPVRVDHAESSFFDDRRRFPPGSVELDCGLLMRKVPVGWAPAETLDAAQLPPGADGADRLVRAGRREAKVPTG